MGSSIIEMVIVLVAAAVMTVLGIQQDVAKHRAEVLATEGQNELTIVDALGEWANDNYATILSAYNSSGSSTITPPTIAQLYTAGNLKQPHGNGPFWGGTYVIQMSMVPAGCTEAAGNCAISYAMYPSQPLRKGAQYDVDGASQIAQAGGAQFGFSRTQGASTITGLNGGWTATNPLGNLPAVVLATNGPGTDGNSLYIRRDGSLTWTGSQDVNGVDLHNVGSIDATGTIAAPTLAASNVAVSNAVQTPGTLLVQNATGTAPAPINTGAATIQGNATVTGTVTVGNIAVPDAACSGTGIAGDTDGTGVLFSCQRGQWKAIGGSWLRYGFYSVANGTGVPAPVCATGGVPEIVVTPQNAYIDPTAEFNFSVSGTGPWTVYITDGGGGAIPGWGEATTYCAY